MDRKSAILSLKATLVARRDALRKALGTERNVLEEIREQAKPGDTAEAAHKASNEDIGARLIDAETQELRRIGVALKLMDEGVYGVCEDCDCKIPMARLNALPYVTRCIKCQQTFEREGGQQALEDAKWERLSRVSSADEPEPELDPEATAS